MSKQSKKAKQDKAAVPGRHAAESEFAPVLRAARGEALIARDRAEWAHPDGVDPTRHAEHIINDLVHAAVRAVPVHDLPEAVGTLLGRVATDVVTDRQVEAGIVPTPQTEPVERLGRSFGSAVRTRRYGD